jgi:hypothetical protein
MSHHRSAPRLEDDRTTLDGLGRPVMLAGIVVGVLALAAAFVVGRGSEDGLAGLGTSYLVAFAYFLSLSLGALFFVAIQHVTRASWSVVARRIAEVMGANLVVLALLAIPLLVLAPHVFAWAGDGGHAPAELLAKKKPYLNMPFLYVRWAVFFLIWCGYALWFWRKSVEQDRTGDVQISVKFERRSGLALMLYALSVNFASYDLLMSLDPSWFSTMFGPYYFAGGVVSFFAALTVLTLWLQGRGRLTTVIGVEHLHDYGKFLFAFVFFWAYLAFSQYMLIWYANIPEETAWLLRREQNGWGWVGLTLIFGHWLLPFAGLVSRFAKRNRAMLGFWAVWVLVMHYVDLYWIAMPELSPTDAMPSWLDLLCFVGVGGFYVAGLARFASGASLVPTKDPRLGDSLSFENA